MDDVVRELKIRDRIMAIYTQVEADFASAEEYDNYLEMVEDIIFKLTNNIDVIETEEQVRDYERRKEQAEKQAEANAAGAAGAAAAALVYGRPQAAGAAVQPVPLAQVQQDPGGRLLPPQRGPLPRSQLLEAARASGWSPDIPKRRALHEAFSTVFVY